MVELQEVSDKDTTHSSTKAKYYPSMLRSGMWEIRNAVSGPIPVALEGIYQTSAIAAAAIVKYILDQEEKRSKVRPYHKSRKPKQNGASTV